MHDSNELLEMIQIQALSWRRQGIACPPIKLSHAQAILAANRVVLPPDFVQMYCVANGTPELYPNWLDKNYCSFLPLEKLHTEYKKWVVVDTEAAKTDYLGVTVFVDFMHRSWEYGFIRDASAGTYKIGIMAGDSEFKVLTNSLATFLKWYLEDADTIYDYSHSFTDLGRSNSLDKG